MTTTQETHPTLKQRAVSEMQKYVGYTIYLFIVFAVFSNYRRLVLKEYEIVYLNYSYAIIEALILAKIVLIGEAFKLGERHADEPLIIPTLYKSFLFGVLLAAFTVLEKFVSGAIHHRDLAEIGQDIVSKGADEMLARTLMILVAFVPFFAFLELQSVLGKGFLDLFFSRKARQELSRSR